MQDAVLETVMSVWGWVRVALIFLFGPLNYQLGYLLLVMCVDLYLGIKVARKNKCFSLKFARDKTIEKTVIYCMWVILANALDRVLGLPGTARFVCLIILLGCEIISSLNNTSNLGYVAVSKLLRDFFLGFIGKVTTVSLENIDDKGDKEDKEGK